MVTDGQVSELRRWLAPGKSLAAAARMASMDKKTARRNLEATDLVIQRAATDNSKNSDRIQPELNENRCYQADCTHRSPEC